MKCFIIIIYRIYSTIVLCCRWEMWNIISALLLMWNWKINTNCCKVATAHPTLSVHSINKCFEQCLHFNWITWTNKLKMSACHCSYMMGYKHRKYIYQCAPNNAITKMAQKMDNIMSWQCIFMQATNCFASPLHSATVDCVL